jgi:hypothetical protein
MAAASSKVHPSEIPLPPSPRPILPAPNDVSYITQINLITLSKMEVGWKLCTKPTFFVADFRLLQSVLRLWEGETVERNLQDIRALIDQAKLIVDAKIRDKKLEELDEWIKYLDAAGKGLERLKITYAQHGTHVDSQITAISAYLSRNIAVYREKYHELKTEVLHVPPTPRVPRP